MRTSLLTLARTAGVVALLATTGCQTADRAGGNADSEVTLLTFAQPNHGLPEQLKAWAEDVEKLSDSELKIEFKEGWRTGEVDYESATIADVRAGKVDAAWVGARAFDVAGVDSFQALLAPLLVDSHELQRRVFEEGIPGEMLAEVESLDLAGIGVLPGPMRRMLGRQHPYLAPDDFEGDLVGLQDSALAAQTFDSLGAQSERLPSGADISDVDGYEQQLDSIAGNHYELSAKHVTVNVNLWPRPLVLFANSETFDGLSDAHQEALTTAAESAILPALEASVVEDARGAQKLCDVDMNFHEASASQLEALRKAVEPVYRKLASVPATKGWLDRIIDLKQDAGASPDTAGCQETASAPTQGSTRLPDGTYTQVVTPEDIREACTPGAPGSERLDEPWTKLTHDVELEVKGDRVRQWWTPTDGSSSREIGWSGAYTLFRDQIKLTEDGAPGGDIIATWSFDGKQLVISDLDVDWCDAISAWTSHPWVLAGDDKSAGSVEGTYRMAVDWTRTKPAGCPPSGEEGESEHAIYDLTLADGSVELYARLDGHDSARKPGFFGTYQVFRDQIEISDGGFDLKATFSLDGDRLTLSNMTGGECGDITLWTTKPWLRTDE